MQPVVAEGEGARGGGSCVYSQLSISGARLSRLRKVPGRCWGSCTAEGKARNDDKERYTRIASLCFRPCNFL
jgi:hypothetical protein